MKWKIPETEKFNYEFAYSRNLHAIVRPEIATISKLTPDWCWEVCIDYDDAIVGTAPTYDEAIEAARRALATVLPDLIEDINTTGVTS